MSLFGRAACLAVLTTALTAQANPTAAAELKPDAEFSVGRHGAHLCVPLAFGSGWSSKALIDTGATVTILDVRLRPPSPPVGKRLLRTPGGDVTAELHAPSKACIGPLNLETLRAVAYADLESLRQALGEDVQCIIGMDLLCHVALEYDPDRGRLSVWRSAPREWSQNTRIPLHDHEGLLAVEVQLPQFPRERLLVDTGATTSTLREEVFDALAKEGSLNVTHAQETATVMGSAFASAGFLRQMGLDEHSLNGIRVDRANESVLGLRQLSRFVVRANFPEHALYLNRGAHFDLPDFTATSGMSVVFVNQRIVVRSIEPGGPAERAGVRSGDVIMAVNGRPASSYDRAGLAAEFTRQAGRLMDVEVLRDGDVQVVRLTTQCRLRDSSHEGAKPVEKR